MIIQVKTNRVLKGGNDGKPIDGIWVCTRCDNVESSEREITCWYCGVGEMIYFDRIKLRDKLVLGGKGPNDLSEMEMLRREVLQLRATQRVLYWINLLFVVLSFAYGFFMGYYHQ